MELRCKGKLHGIMLEDEILEVKCRSRWCGANKETVVLHKIDIHTGNVTTVRFANPIKKG